METKHLDVDFELKALKDDGTFSGYGSVFNVVDLGRDVVLPGAFTRTLGEHEKKGTNPALLWQHDLRDPLGVVTALKEDRKGLLVEARLLVDDDPTAKRAYAHLKAGSVKGLSIGYTVPRGGQEWDDQKGVRRLKDIDLHEVSLVTVPMNPSARVTAVKAAERVTTIREFEDFLRDEGGFSHAAAKAIAARGFKAQSDPRDEGDGLSDLANALKVRGASLQSLITR